MSNKLKACEILANGKSVSITNGDYNSIKIFTSSTETISPNFTYDEFMAKVKELDDALPMERLREQRNLKLTETDWWCASDRTPTQAQLDYRTALRDLPSTASPSLDENGNLTGVEWPTKPE